MNDFKKHKLKEWFRKKKVFLIAFGGFALIGLIALIVGMKLSGASFIEYFCSPFAITVYIFIIIGLCVLGVMFYFDFVKRKSGGDE